MVLMRINPRKQFPPKFIPIFATEEREPPSNTHAGTDWQKFTSNLPAKKSKINIPRFNTSPVQTYLVPL